MNLFQPNQKPIQQQAKKSKHSGRGFHYNSTLPANNGRGRNLQHASDISCLSVKRKRNEFKQFSNKSRLRS